MHPWHVQTYAGGREFRFRGDLYSQESTFPLVNDVTDLFDGTVRCIFKQFSGRLLVQNVCLVAQSDNVAVDSSVTAVLLLVRLR